MKIAYIANARIPTEKAHGAQIMHTCAAFAEEGAVVELIVPERKNTITEDPFSYYAVKEQFPIRKVFTLDWVRFGRIGFLIESLAFALCSLRRLRLFEPDVVYGRDELILWVVSLFSTAPLLWESHTGSWNWFARSVARSAHTVVVISEGLADFYAQKGVPREKIVVAHDGIDLEAFAAPQSKEAARERLGLPRTASVALYIGRLDGWKGVGTLFEAASKMPQVCVAVIGGEEKQLETLKKKYPSIMFLGYRPYREVADNQAAADVLILPNTAGDPVSSRFTSPLKLFTYMASGKPMVVSDLPSLRAVVGEDEAYFFTANDSESLAAMTVHALADTHAYERAEHAKELVQDYTWHARARCILARLRD